MPRGNRALPFNKRRVLLLPTPLFLPSASPTAVRSAFSDHRSPMSIDRALASKESLCSGRRAAFRPRCSTLTNATKSARPSRSHITIFRMCIHIVVFRAHPACARARVVAHSTRRSRVSFSTQVFSTARGHKPRRRLTFLSGRRQLVANESRKALPQRLPSMRKAPGGVCHTGQHTTNGCCCRRRSSRVSLSGDGRRRTPSSRAGPRSVRPRGSLNASRSQCRSGENETPACWPLVRR